MMSGFTATTDTYVKVECDNGQTVYYGKLYPGSGRMVYRVILNPPPISNRTMWSGLYYVESNNPYITYTFYDEMQFKLMMD